MERRVVSLEVRFAILEATICKPKSNQIEIEIRMITFWEPSFQLVLQMCTEIAFTFARIQRPRFAQFHHAIIQSAGHFGGSPWPIGRYLAGF